MRIQSRLLWLVFAAWLPSALAIGVVARTAYIDLRTSALDDVQRLADGLVIIVERELDKRHVMARTLSSSTALQFNDLERFYTEASRATRDTDSWVSVLTPGRQILSTAMPYDPALSIPLPKAPKWLLDGDSIYFNPHGPIVQKPFIGIVSAQASSPVDYNLMVAFRPDVLDTAVAKQTPPHDAVIAIMDHDMRVMSRSREAAKWRGTGATEDIRRRARAKKAGFERSMTLDKVPSLTYLSAPNRYGWYTIVAVPEAALNHEARMAAMKAVGLAVTLLGLSLLFAFYVARSISEPILQLKEAADELGKERIPDLKKTGILEADQVAKAMREAGLRTTEAAHVLEVRIADAVARTAEVQQTLAEAQKREALGRLAGGVAHDFNNLLQTISAALHMLTPNIPEGPPRRMLDAASRATGKASGLVKQMLAFGRAQKLEPTSVDLNDFLLRVCELASKAAGPNVLIRANVASKLPAVFVDPTQLELALLNLIFNARDAMQGQGEISIRAFLDAGASADPTPAPASARLVVLEVRDTGPGMDEDTLRKAFDPYFTTKPVGSGSGLGLPQVQSFTRQSGGSVNIISEPGSGTTVQMLLPSTAVPAALRPSREIDKPDSSRALRVLMVEDDPLVASVVLPAIEDMGHSVTQCVTADQAKGRIQQGGMFDVVFSDVVMPGFTNGFDLAKWCAAQTPPIPVVLATGYSAKAPETEVVVLRKPYDLNELARALQEAAQHAAPRS